MNRTLEQRIDRQIRANACTLHASGSPPQTGEGSGVGWDRTDTATAWLCVLGLVGIMLTGWLL